jgi:OOP family OmpA-OmpF porin
MKTRVVAWLLASALACATADAQVPSNPYIDSRAPCFRWPAVDVDRAGVFDRVDHCTGTPQGAIVDAYGCPKDSDGDQVYDGLDQCPDTPHGTAVDASGCPEGARAGTVTTPVPLPPAVPQTPPMREMERQLVEKGRIRLENVYFETGSATLLPESETALREAGETVEKYPGLVIEIQGHTDTRGRDQFNLRLSQSRAETVRRFLLDRYKLDADHLLAIGYGETMPETRERNDEELLRNRRVELHVKNPEALPRGVKVEK